jgi:hypothetical protein
MNWPTWLLATCLAPLMTLAQAPSILPDKLQALQSSYEAATARATAPLTATYLKELEKLRLDYTRQGDPEAALAAATLIKNASTPKPGDSNADVSTIPLRQMTVDQFKKWLASVIITETDSPFQNQYTYDGQTLTSTRGGASEARAHDNVIIEVGRLFVPFTSTNATIVVDPSLTKAEISFSTGGKYEGKVQAKAKP